MDICTTVDVKKILASLFGHYGTDWELIDGNEELTGVHVGLSASDMVYFLYEIEKQFGICLSEKDLSNYGFSTINNVKKIIAQCSQEV